MVFIFVHIVLFVCYLRCHKNIALKAPRPIWTPGFTFLSKGRVTFPELSLGLLVYLGPSFATELPCPWPSVMSTLFVIKGPLARGGCFGFISMYVGLASGMFSIRGKKKRKKEKVSFTWGQMISAVISHKWPGHDFSFHFLMSALFDSVHIPH